MQLATLNLLGQCRPGLLLHFDPRIPNSLTEYFNRMEFHAIIILNIHLSNMEIC